MKPNMQLPSMLIAFTKTKKIEGLKIWHMN